MRIDPLDPVAATGTTKTLLNGVQAQLGTTPNLMKLLARAPAALEGYLRLSGALASGALTPALREQLALRVAEQNGCDYCLAAHSLLGRGAGLSPTALDAARAGTADEPRAAAALAFADRVLATRGAVADADLARAHAAGLDDGAILEIVAHVALNVLTNYANNVARTTVDFPPVRPAAKAA